MNAERAVQSRLRMQLKQFRRRMTYSRPFIRMLSSLATFFIILYTRTLKIRFHYDPEMQTLDKHRICYGFWHGTQFLLLLGFRKWNTTLMSDISWAGHIQTEILTRLGYRVVRGSSKRKGAEALIAMKNAVSDGYSCALALDGPRGPIHQSKPGILFLAKKFGYPIVPLVACSDRAWIMKRTWCRYSLPKPFSRCLVAMGKPIEEASRGELTLSELDQHMMVWVHWVEQRMKSLISWK